MTDKLYIIDGHAHIYAAYFAPMTQQLTSPAGEPVKAVYIFTSIMLSMIKRYKPDMLVVTMDSKAPTFRKEMYADYKANRPPMPDDLPRQIELIEQVLRAMNIPILRKDGFEADDLIGTITQRASKKNIECVICSKDKDVLQLLNDYVCALDIQKDIKTTAETLKEDRGISPLQFLDCLALQGDTSDNVPGVPDVGPKTALTWIQTYGDIENLYENAHEIKGKRGQSLRDSREIVDLSKRLVTIDCNVDIAIDFDSYRMCPFDQDILADIFKSLGFNRFLSQLDLPGKEDFVEAAAESVNMKTDKHIYQLIDTETQLDELLVNLHKQSLFAIDTETTSVRPMYAQLVGISLAWKTGEAFYIPVKAPLGTRCIDLGILQQKLGPILADESVKKVGQNIKYDMLVLDQAGLPLKGIYFDTMVGSYCLNPGRQSHSMDNMALDYLNYECIGISELIGKGKKQITFDLVDTTLACDYAAEDADITLRLYEYIKPRLQKETQLQELFDTVEMPLVSVLACMEAHGVCLDTACLRSLSNDISRTLDNVTDEIYKYSEVIFNIDSPKQLAGILFDRLELTSVRKGKTGRSTDAAVLEQLSDKHPIVKLVLKYRQLTKLRNTYIDKLGGLVSQRTNRIHTSFNQTVTATGRLSSSAPNLQNIPIRTELGKKIRNAFISGHEDNCLLAADYSQIELRLLAHLSQDSALCSAFESDQDIHRFVASQIHGIDLDEVTDEMRSECKAVNFGIIYGQGAFGLSRTVGMTVGQAKQFIAAYFARYGSIRSFMDKVIEGAGKKGYVETILHRRRPILDIHSSNHNSQAQAKRLAVNTVVQGSAADLIKVAMINIQRRIDKEHLPLQMLLQVHDELVFELPKAQALEYAQWIEEEMLNAMHLDVPLKVSIGYGPTWLSSK